MTLPIVFSCWHCKACGYITVVTTVVADSEQVKCCSCKGETEPYPPISTFEDKFEVIRAIAIEHSSSQDYSSCRCGHVNSHHHDKGWGRCQTCDHVTCPRFRGINRTMQRKLERFGLAMLAALEGSRVNS
jgi:hypothetical protein